MNAVKDVFEDGVHSIILNRPDKKNAMDSELLIDLYTALEKANSQGAQIITIRGSGKAFCAGGDLLEFNQSPDAGPLIDAMADNLHKSIMLIRNTSAMVVAVVEGVAVGAGLGLSLACDLSLAAKTAVMNLGYRRIGLTPDGGGSYFLPKLIGAKRFSELYLLSLNINMTEALSLGLVNFVCEEDEIDGKLQEIIRNLRALPMETIQRHKHLLNNTLFPGLQEHLDLERRYVKDLASEPLFKERLAAFFTRR
jgi:2-(1,2-epoxy-1,2-dihydrophenyl)acetyl-CoA isomerase